MCITVAPPCASSCCVNTPFLCRFRKERLYIVEQYALHQREQGVARALRRVYRLEDALRSLCALLRAPCTTSRCFIVQECRRDAAGHRKRHKPRTGDRSIGKQTTICTLSLRSHALREAAERWYGMLRPCIARRRWRC